MTSCTADGCGLPVRARGLCRRHYLQAWRDQTLTEHSSSRAPLPECPPGPGHTHTVDGCWALHGCRCSPCRHSRKMERQRRRTRLRAYGREDQIRPRRVDAAPARAVLQRLLDTGFALERIAIAAGVSHSTLTTLRFGRRGAAAGVHLKTIEAVVAEALLRLEPQAISTSTVPATGTTRRLQALVATGQTQSAIAELLGRGVGNLSPLVHGRRKIVTLGTHDAVKALFDALWDQRREGPMHDAARRLAERHGWLPPLAWDDPDIDPEPPAVDRDPDLVDDIAVVLALQGDGPRLTPAERRICVRTLWARKYSDTLIAATIRCDAKTVGRIREELDLPAFDQTELIQHRAA